MEQKTLLDRVVSRLNAGNYSVRELCQETGISVRWYYKFMAGEIKDPGIRRIQRISDYFSGIDAQTDEEAA